MGQDHLFLEFHPIRSANRLHCFRNFQIRHKSTTPSGERGQRRQQAQQGQQQQSKEQKRKAAQRRKQAEAEVVGGTTTAVATAAEEGADVLEAALEEPGLEPEPALEPEEPEPELEECAICLSDLPLPGDEEGSAVPLACSHIFHTLCLERWKGKSLEKTLPYTCTMCTAIVVVVTPANKP